MTLDDVMQLRSIVDVEIAPDGEHVAYVASTPSVEKNAHEVALFVVPVRGEQGGGEPRRLGEGVRILNAPLPAPRLRWSPDGATIEALALAGERPQAFAVPLDGSAARQLTAAPEGVSSFVWSPDGKSVAYLTRDPLPPEEAKSRALVTRAGAPDPPSRLVVVSLVAGVEAAAAPRTLTPPAHYVDSFSWFPDGRELAYSAAPRSGFTAIYETSIYAVPVAGGEPRLIVNGCGMNQRSEPVASSDVVEQPARLRASCGINRGPDVSPDGKLVAFTSTNGRFDIMAPRSLAVVPACGMQCGGEPRILPLGDAWVNEHVWASDSRSLYLQANDGTFGQGEQMFEQPIVRVWVDGGRAEQVTRGAMQPAVNQRREPRASADVAERAPAAGGREVNYALSMSRDGRRLAYRAVLGQTMGDVVVLDTEKRQAKRLTDVNPQLRELRLARVAVVSWRSFDGMEIRGLLLTPRGRMPGTRLPLLVYVHGGPGGGFTHGLFPQFMHVVGQVDPYPTEALASAGYALLLPMPRGGAGYARRGSG